MKKFLRIAVPLVFYALLLVFLAYYLTTIDYALLFSIRFDWGYLIAATVVALAVLYSYVAIWIVILRSIGAQLGWSSALVLVYAKAWLGRYIPGKLPWILGKIYFASREGVPRSKLAVSSMLEAALQVVSQLVIAAALLVFDVRLDVVDPQLKLLMLVVLVGGIIAILPPVFNWLLALAYRLFRREFGVEHRASWGTVLQGGGLYAVAGVANGIALFLIAKSAAPELGWEYVFFVAGASILAGAIGMVAVFAPSGLGVRDGILLVLLGLIMPTETALAVTVFSRLWAVAVDLLFFGTAWTAHRLVRGRASD